METSISGDCETIKKFLLNLLKEIIGLYPMVGTDKISLEISLVIPMGWIIMERGILGKDYIPHLKLKVYGVLLNYK